jgi:4-amino-4-deoxy-L-arabinose transferase-like glycosyltransferase
MSTINAKTIAAHPGVQVPRSTQGSELALGRADALNLALLLGAFVVVLLIVPPWRSYPMIDDWAYAQSVQRLWALDYRPHDYVQPTSLGHLVWGVLFTGIFGFSFNVLTAANLVISAGCLVLFYALLRRIGIAPGYALFATALLGYNPIYLHLSYSFMTDITFTAYILAACICYLEGVRSGKSAWLWAGGALTALAYLTRQPGVLVAVAALLYLWWVGRLNRRTVMAAALLPVLAVVAFMVWERTQPPQMVSYLVQDAMQKVLANPWGVVVVQAQRVVWVVTILGWALLPVIVLARRPLLALVLYVGFVFFQLRGVTFVGTMFPEFGNIVDRTGFVLYDYRALPVWNVTVWSLIGLLGTLFLSLFIVSYGERLVAWLRSRPWRGERDADPVLMLYFTLALMGLLTFASPFLFDRYLLPLLPFLMVPALRKLQASANGRVAVWRWALVLPLLVFFLVAQTDYKVKAATRWEAAESVVVQGVLPEHVIMGTEWTGWMYYEKAVAYIREHGTTNASELVSSAYAIEDPEYIVAEMPVEGYDVVRRIPYTAWLEGGQERAVLVLKRR